MHAHSLVGLLGGGRGGTGEGLWAALMSMQSSTPSATIRHAQQHQHCNTMMTSPTLAVCVAVARPATLHDARPGVQPRRKSCRSCYSLDAGRLALAHPWLCCVPGGGTAQSPVPDSALGMRRGTAAQATQHKPRSTPPHAQDAGAPLNGVRTYTGTLSSITSLKFCCSDPLLI